MVGIIKKTMLAIATVLALAAPAQAKDDVTLIVGEKAATLDVKVMGEVAPKVGLFIRGRTTVEGKEEVRYFGVTDLTYSLGKGVGLVAETQTAPGIGFVPRVGADYFGKVGDLTQYVELTASKTTGSEVELLTSTMYKPEMGTIDPLVELETITDAGKEGITFAVQRLRAGIETAGIKVGAETDFTEDGQGKMDYVVSGFVGKTF